jgi:predicted kinase
MATLHLLVGLPCSGKTTLARQLESEHSALRLGADEWVTQLLGVEATGESDRAHDIVEGLLWQLAERLLVLSVDVVLDFGCWAREEREHFRNRAAALGAGSRLYYLDVSEDELLDRLIRRNADLPADTFRIEPELLVQWARQLFQPPTPDELLPREPSPGG